MQWQPQGLTLVSQIGGRTTLVSSYSSVTSLGYTMPVEHEQFLTSSKPQPAQAA